MATSLPVLDVALMGSVSSTPSYLSRIGLADGSQHTEVLIGLINAIYWVGVIIGALLISPVSDKIGRRRAIFCAGLYAIIVIPILAALQNFSWVLVLRFLNGLATGSFDSVGLNWSAESTASRYRGRAIGLQMCCAAIGASTSYFLVYGISKVTDSEIVWRFPIAYQCVFVFLVSGLVWVLPESPRWLVRVGLIGEARDVLLAMQADQAEEIQVGEMVDEEIRSIQQALHEEFVHNSSTTYLSMFFKKDPYKTSRRTWSALFVQFATQAMVGSGVVSGYGIKIFESGGWSSDLAALLSGIGIIVQAIFGFIGAMYADKIGRRRAFIYGALNGSILLVFVGMCGHFVSQNMSDQLVAKRYSSAVIALVMVWSAQFGMTWLWAPFTYPSEIFPARSRARGSSVGIVGLGLGSFFTSMISPYIFAAMGSNAMFLFGGLSFVVAVVSNLYLPETAKKTLEDINHLYD
ncbi:Low-affinity glucose transporter [Penicillium nucicola]|uniref:Low-affinity glucose transporter n=1 Tax=Penicillium nucicola TaxID=1850975 RepID=UPI002545B626|nr:Low-affinity glucose transporter [Penicillium nucicola]KAJ5758170.1 Low-affinity glucose transporter [Penicillium nucicola]